MSQAIGFPGNQDIYGIGIRVGYYTQAASLWVANLWAPHLTSYLHTVTLLYLVALLVGVSMISVDPSGTHAIEPFMLMQVAYDTYYMGLSSGHTPDLLAWEYNYFKESATIFIALCLHGYDTWYWWVGLHKMIPTPGVVGTLGLFTYFGRQDIYSWINIPMKIINGILIFALTKTLVRLVALAGMQKRVDGEMSPVRLKELADEWVKEVDPTGMLRDEPTPDGPTTHYSQGHLSPPVISRHPSSTSIRSKASSRSPSRLSCHDSEHPPGRRSPSPATGWSDGRGEKSPYARHYENNGSIHKRNVSSLDTDEGLPAPTPGIQRTFSDRMRYRFLRWSTNDDQAGPVTEPTYNPEFQKIVQATEFLASLNTKTPQSWQIIRAPAFFCYSLFRCTVAFFTHRLRPRVFLAVHGHMKALAHSRKHCWPEIWRRTFTSPAYQTLSSTDIAVASRIYLTLHPVPPPARWQTIGLAYCTFSTCSLLVIGTELTINWNGISGVQKLNTVGQLIPFSLGVGGLLQVVWSALFEHDAGEKLCFGKCHATRRREDWSEASKLYQRAGEAWEKKRDSDTNKEALGA